MESKPLETLDKLEALDGENEKTDLVFPKCKHELYIISSTEVRCKKCPAGWFGVGVYKLAQ